MSDINPNSRNNFVDNNGRLSKYGMDTILKLYRALQFRGDSTLFDDILASKAFAISTSLEQPEYEFISVSSDFTAYTYSFLNVTSQCTVTLNDTPEDGEQIIVHKNTGNTTDYIEVTDGTGIDRFLLDQTVMSYRYSLELDQWVRGS